MKKSKATLSLDASSRQLEARAAGLDRWENLGSKISGIRASYIDGCTDHVRALRKRTLGLITWQSLSPINNDDGVDTVNSISCRPQ